MTVQDAHVFFANIPTIERKLGTLVDVGLGYIRLGQPATTLSGGEAQRVKLASELAKRATGRDALHPGRADHRPALRGYAAPARRAAATGGRRNTIIVIEHNLDVVKSADWIIDLGPEGGDGVASWSWPVPRKTWPRIPTATPAPFSRGC